MKYLILIGDGMGDRPLEQLGGKTVLQHANTPHMDRLAREGLLGLARTIPKGMSPGSDTANMSLMGCDPRRFHTGRAPIEAAAMGVDMAEGDVAFRCNLVNLGRQDGKVIMADYAAGHIQSQPAAELIRSLDQALGRQGLRFHSGVSYRHLLLWQGGPLRAATVPPHDRSGQAVDDVLSLEGDMALVNRLISDSWPVLRDHPVNQARQAAGQVPANSIWLWGQGTKPQLPTFAQRFGLSGLTISAVDLIKGLGVLVGLPPVEVPGATGLLDTNFSGKVEAALKGLETADLAFVHVEAPDEAGHSGVLQDKIAAVEAFDAQVVGPLLEGLAGRGHLRLLLATDHHTPLAERTHNDQPVPFVIWDSEQPRQGDQGFNEPAAQASGLMEPEAHRLVKRLIEGE